MPLTVGFMMAAMAAATMIAGAASLGRSSAVTYARAACFMLPFVVIPSAMCSIAGWDFMVFAPSPYFAPGPNLSDFYLLLMWRASDWLQACTFDIVTAPLATRTNLLGLIDSSCLCACAQRIIHAVFDDQS